ncbi:MobF family relaxase [Nocardioides caldifontis]|uniref:MobF family relaxase n=1 Tax=Nocardioides caldifontis TaxID=2588938 RepID=UPI001EF04DE4|nr:MobF family relaxase [Nocardioides caldifontis]
MTVSLRKMSPGDGYKYLLRTVAAGDGNRSLSTPLTRYYAEVGTPPGRWLGSGLCALGRGELRPRDRVHEAQLALLIGLGRDPLTGDQLGRAFPEYQGVEARIAVRTAAIPADVCGEDRDDMIARIEAEESVASNRRAVAGFDFTFSVPKSVSVLWGVADADLQAMIVEAHHAAVAEVIDYLEREVAATRTGISNHDGAVAQVGVSGVIAAAFDHYDSRAGDPQLHTHVVIANKVKTLLDGRWRSLDSRAIHAAVTAISAHYNAVLADRLSGTFGLRWEARERGPDRNPQWEIAGVSEELIREFSGRTREIEAEKDRLVEAYVARHGRRPSRATIVQLRAQATLATRPEKQVRSLADLTGEWRRRAGRITGGDAGRWARAVLSVGVPEAADAASVSLDLIQVVARQVVDEVSTKRSTWRSWNLWASASKQTMGWRFRTVADREAVVGLIVDAAQGLSVALTPPEFAVSPGAFCREDGTSVFRPRHATVYSSTDVLAAEDRLLAHAEVRAAPAIEQAAVTLALAGDVASGCLSAEQADAIGRVASSGRGLDLLVGPAGAGKTTAMRGLRRAWVSECGPRSVVGLAPSAAAARALAEDLGIACDNTAKWLHEHARGNVTFGSGQLVIIDEATLADTRTLDRLTEVAAAAGAKVLLVGDDAQLQSVDAGGAFSMLAEARGSDLPELTEILRFNQEWERQATAGLRGGEAAVIDSYARHDRLREGTTDQMLDAAYAAWREDTRRGLDSVLVTEAAHSVHALNARARAERILAHDDDTGPEVELVDGARASAGDIVITRRNARRLRALNGGWVRNGDRWLVLDVRRDGAMTVRRAGGRLAATLMLPPEYVAHHVDLGYAVTAHRAQGITVDTSHVVASASTTRENFYVSMTRGRDSNIAYVALDQPDDSHATPRVGDETARTVLHGVLQHSGAEPSAHQAITTEHETWSSIAQLAAEYETIAAAAQRDRFADLLQRSGLTDEQVHEAVSSAAFGPLTAALRLAEANRHDLERLLPRIVAAHPLKDAADVAAVLRYRIEAFSGATPGAGLSRSPMLIAGLIPEAVGSMDCENRQALDQRKDLIVSRARALAVGAVASRASWLNRLGTEPPNASAKSQWMTEVATVAAYRDRYNITSEQPLGGPSRSDIQRNERRRANTAARRAQRLAGGHSGCEPQSLAAYQVAIG